VVNPAGRASINATVPRGFSRCASI